VALLDDLKARVTIAAHEDEIDEAIEAIKSL
jgi:hypothetical protein